MEESDAEKAWRRYGHLNMNTAQKAEVCCWDTAEFVFGPASYTILVTATNGAGLTTTNNKTFLIDTSTPEKGVVIEANDDDIKHHAGFNTDQDLECQIDHNKIFARWNYAHDDESGIDHYEWAVGTRPAPDDLTALTGNEDETTWNNQIGAWIDAGLHLEGVTEDLNLISGQVYYVNVKMYNKVGKFSYMSSNGVRVVRNKPDAVNIRVLGEEFGLARIEKISGTAITGLTMRFAERYEISGYLNKVPVSPGDATTYENALATVLELTETEATIMLKRRRRVMVVPRSSLKPLPLVGAYIQIDRHVMLEPEYDFHHTYSSLTDAVHVRWNPVNDVSGSWVKYEWGIGTSEDGFQIYGPVTIEFDNEKTWKNNPFERKFMIPGYNVTDENGEVTWVPEKESVEIHYQWEKDFNASEIVTNATGLELKHNQKYYISLKAINCVGYHSHNLKILHIDLTPPNNKTAFVAAHNQSKTELASLPNSKLTTHLHDDQDPVMCSYQSSNETISVSWDGFEDLESGIVFYQVALGSFWDQDDIVPFQVVPADQLHYVWEDLYLEDGRVIFVTVQAVNDAGLNSSAYRVIVPDASPPEVGELWDGYSESFDVDCQSDWSVIGASWSGWADPHSGPLSYEWAIGHKPLAGDIQNYTSTDSQRGALRRHIVTMFKNEQIYVSLKVTNMAGLQHEVVTDGVRLLCDETGCVCTQGVNCLC